MYSVFIYSIYPLLLILGFSAHVLFYYFTKNYFLSAYLSIFLMASFISFLEFLRPLHKEWKPTFKDLLGDILLYTVGVQLFFPLILSFLGIFFLKRMGFENGQIFSIWPRNLSLYWQLLLLALGGEFLFYWWHRLAHTFQFFWPIHAVHHFPTKLYAINTVRFHFLDKTIEFIFTIFLFYQLGAGLELISYYYIFFVATGLIQHCNFDARLGWFDYIFASGETHRFHHDRVAKNSRCNYANNLVLWDLVFNTFKRETHKPITELGIKNHIDQGLLSETLYPLKHFFKIFFDLSIASVVFMRMKFIHFFYFSKLKKATKDPAKTQYALLFNLLKKNANTIFGKEHRFLEITTIEDFKKFIPIQDYEMVRPYIERFFSGETQVLTASDPHYFNKTSGTTGKPKYLPVNTEVQKNYLMAQKILSYTVYSKDSKSLEGLIYSVVGSVEEELLFGKWPAGAMSGKSLSLTPKFIKKKYVFNEKIADLQDFDKKNLYLAALALLVPNVTGYLSPNPSTFLKIIEIVNTKKKEIRELINDTEDQILKPYQKNTTHALELLERNNELKICDLWVNLKIVVLWMGGSCSYLIPRVKKSLDPKTQIIELGYLSSEFYGTITADVKKNIQIPTLQDNYFEFIEKENYVMGERETLQLHELKDQCEYYIIVTTPSGLYRYFMNDIVKVDGFYEKTPSLIFIQKGKGMTNLTGEKLSEKQLVSFFEETKDLEGVVKFFICLADQELQKYTLYLELSENRLSPLEIENKLHEYLLLMNVEYATKVKSKRLAPIEIQLLKPHTVDTYRAHCLNSGQRESQFKFLYLQYTKDVNFPFDLYTIK